MRERASSRERERNGGGGGGGGRKEAIIAPELSFFQAMVEDIRHIKIKTNRMENSG